MLGTIKCVKEKGFGFIMPKDGGPDVFFHASKVCDVKFEELHEGQDVEFDTITNSKGVSALEVRPV